MHTLREGEGSVPVRESLGSRHDVCGAGHACTAICAALGILEARQQRNLEGSVVAVIGDGALTGGLTFEGLNNAGASRHPLVVVLNDNEMSISVNVGAVSQALRGLGARMFFESLGFAYWGPVDGHDLNELLSALREATRANKPIVAQSLTQKGKGFAAAEAE